MISTAWTPADRRAFTRIDEVRAVSIAQHGGPYGGGCDECHEHHTQAINAMFTPRAVAAVADWYQHLAGD